MRSLAALYLQIVVAVLGCYATLFGLVKIKSALSAKPPVPKKVEAAPVASSTANKWGFEVPTLENFDAWGENDANWKAWEKFMEGPLLDKWADELK